jgi:hypothetical protein
MWRFPPAERGGAAAAQRPYLGRDAGSEGGQNHLGFPLSTAGRLDFIRLKMRAFGHGLSLSGAEPCEMGRTDVAGPDKVHLEAGGREPVTKTIPLPRTRAISSNRRLAGANSMVEKVES